MLAGRPLVVLLLAALAVAQAAHAHGDPVSEALATRDVFLPDGRGIPDSLARALTEELADARKAGYPMKVAIISSQGDLGLLEGLWLKPRQYASYLGKDLRSLHRGPIVVAMPNGFGAFRDNQSVVREQRILGSIQIRPGAAGLTESSRDAVRRLAGTAGSRLKSGSGGSVWLDRVLIAGGAIVVLGLLAVIRRKTHRRRVSAAGSPKPD